MPSLRYLEAQWVAMYYALVILRLKPDVVVVRFAG